MKRPSSLFFAILSTMLLAVGAGRAADKLDPLHTPDVGEPSDLLGGSDAESRLPALPCLGPRSQL